MSRLSLEGKHVLPPFRFLSHLLDVSFQSRSLPCTAAIHARLLRIGFSVSPTLHAKLLLSYAAASAIIPTNLLTTLGPPNPDHPIQWNTTMSAFACRGFPSLAVRTFYAMHARGVPSDTYALCSAISASASAGDLGFGRQVHAHVCKVGFTSCVFVGGALIDLYSKSYLLEDARGVFDEMPVRNTVCVNALMAGYSDGKLWDEGFGLLRSMDAIGMEPDAFTLSIALRMCAEVPSAALGMQAHARLIRGLRCSERDVFVQSGLVEMYGKCGLVPKARLVFDIAREQRSDIVLWTSMLNSYSRNGMFEDVIATFEDMLAEGSSPPDEVAFVTVISACSRGGYIAQGIKYFESMRHGYKIEPWPEHHGCMMDLLCRAGELDKAWKFANEMVGVSGIEASSSVWGALLTACRTSGNVEMGRVAARRALELDPCNIGIYVELSNLYARAGMWGEIEELRKGKGMKKPVGCSWLELAG